MKLIIAILIGILAIGVVTVNVFNIASQNDGASLDVDTNNNEVWDYVDAFIDEEYEDADFQAALRQLAILMQRAASIQNDKATSNEIAVEMAAIIDCIYVIDEAMAASSVDDLKSVLLNSKAKTANYRTFSKNNEGQFFDVSFSLGDQRACDAIVN